jgi:hypothetical protein
MKLWTMLALVALATPAGSPGQEVQSAPTRGVQERDAPQRDSASDRVQRAWSVALGMGARENPFSGSTAGETLAALVAVANLRVPWKSNLVVEPELGLWVEEENRKPLATCSGLPCAARTHIVNLGLNLIFTPRLGSWATGRLGGGWAMNVQHDTGRPSLWAVAGGLNVQAGLDMDVAQRTGVVVTARGDAVGRFALAKLYLGLRTSLR